MSSRSVAVLLPVKAFQHAKLRLAPALDQAERAALAREMAGKVVRAAGHLPVAVVCDDDDVAAWAARAGATITRVGGCHAVYVSNPQAVADIIKDAAAGTKSASQTN